MKKLMNNYINKLDLKGKIANIITKIKQFMCNNDVELCIFGGCFFILYATFLINYIAFLYVMGAMLFSLGVFLLKFPNKK